MKSGSIFRTLFAVIWCGIGTFYGGIFFLLSSLFKGGGRIMHYLMRIWSRWCAVGFGVKVTVEGGENVSKALPQIFAVNHPSLFDAMILSGWAPVRFRWMVSHKWYDAPLVGWFAGRMGAMIISSADPQSLAEASRVVRNGKNAAFFPEGKRNYALGKFGLEGFWAAQQAGVTVVPVSITGAREILSEDNYLIRKRSRVRLVFGKPVDTRDYSEEDVGKLRQAVRDAIIREQPPEYLHPEDKP